MSIAIRSRLSRSMLAVAFVIILSGWHMAFAASVRAAPTPVVQSAVAVVPSGRPGYWAQATCSDGGELAWTKNWQPGSIDGYVGGSFNSCLMSGGSMRLYDEGSVNSTPNSGPLYVYMAPAISYIAGGVVTMTMQSPGGVAYLATPNNEQNPQNLIVNCNSLCTSPVSTKAKITHSGGWLLFAAALCTPPAGETRCSTSGVNAEINITAATILLRNEAKPEAAGFAGTLLSNPASGTAALSFTATDNNGPGVYRVAVQIDGGVVWDQTPNLNGGYCAPTGTYEEALVFREDQPCPQSTAVVAQIPTAAIADGHHHLQVEVEDAAGNLEKVYEGTIAIANHPVAAETPSTTPALPPALIPQSPDRGQCNGSPCDEQARLLGADKQPKTFTLNWTHSAVTLAGRLTSAKGVPISGAQVELSQQVAGAAAPPSRIAATTTGPGGAWRLRVPRGPSRLLKVAYYSHLLDSVPAATLNVQENVKATVSLHAPRRARLGHPVVFSGLLTGGYVPADGESVQMEILYGGRWRTIEVLPTTRRGQWSYRYVFTLGAGTSYLFRAVTVPNGGYPFLSTYSKPVRVTVHR